MSGIYGNKIKRFKSQTKDLNRTIQNKQGTAVDITGATVSFVVSSKPGQVKQFEIAGTLVDATNGQYKIPIAASDYSSLDAGIYTYGETVTGSDSKDVVKFIGDFILEDFPDET